MAERWHCNNWSCPAHWSCRHHFGRSRHYWAMSEPRSRGKDMVVSKDADSCEEYERDKPRQWLLEHPAGRPMPWPALDGSVLA